ncbi:MAG: DUF1538 domain-containing protein [Methanosarcinales archaeon]|jgi:hypothetical protein|nr:DUF1538 domain-containing protein [Methanosarcinales archaeon]
MVFYGLKSTLIEVVQAALPIFILLIVFQVVILKTPIKNVFELIIGLLMVLVGLTIFLQGITIGLFPLGETIGSTLPKKGNIWLIIIFALLLGYAVTLAEPALRILGFQVEELTVGAVPSWMLIHTVAIGVSIAVAISMVRIVLGIPLAYILIPSYLFALILVPFTSKEFLSFAFDSGGVTTGPVTVPLILALGVGISMVLKDRDPIIDGFGLIAMASIGPIITVLILGIFINNMQ